MTKFKLMSQIKELKLTGTLYRKKKVSNFYTAGNEIVQYIVLLCRSLSTEVNWTESN